MQEGFRRADACSRIDRHDEDESARCALVCVSNVLIGDPNVG